VQSGILRLAAFAVTLVRLATAQVATLQIQVVEGEGAVHAPGSRIARPLTVEVTDERGGPVAGAAVSFHLPEQGPGGTLANGLRTDVAMTDGQGRVSLRGLQVNRLPGRFGIRIVASKEQARAGLISAQYVAEPGSGAAAAPGKGKAKWVAVAALVGGGAAVGILAGRSAGPAATVPPTAPPVAASVTAPPVTIGPPTTTVGRP
jgi:hypothetical protein